MKILIADDDAVTRRLLEKSLQRWGYEVMVASDGLEASQLLRLPSGPNLALLDWMMPGLNGLELCREIRADERDSYVYILLLTGKCEKKNVIEGLEAGADDYLTKPVDYQELQVRLRAGTRIIDLMNQLVAARESLRDIATHDSLTGFWSRAIILNLLDKELNRADRETGNVGVILVDLDHFKQINDSYGHLVGDEVIRKTAQVMRGTVRPYDAIGRYGGEEFLVILPGCDQVNSVSHAERLRAAISQVTIDTLSGPISVTASLGVTTLLPTERFANPNSIIQAADSALYRAKLRGRNCVEWGAWDKDGFPLTSTASATEQTASG